MLSESIAESKPRPKPDTPPIHEMIPSMSLSKSGFSAAGASEADRASAAERASDPD